jgi:hypothetical protein
MDGKMKGPPGARKYHNETGQDDAEAASVSGSVLPRDALARTHCLS